MSVKEPSFSPGEILRDELDARDWTYVEFAEILGRPVQAVSEILNDRKEITTETALEIGRALGTGPELLAQPADELPSSICGDEPGAPVGRGAPRSTSRSAASS